MLTLLDCVHWQQRVYRPLVSAHEGGWAMVCEEDQYNPWAWGIVKSNSFNLIALRGSVTPGDWMQDVRSQRGIADGRLGMVPQGFDYGLEPFQMEFTQFEQDKPLVIIGHSLGAARACLLAGVLRYQGKRVDGLVLFGSPKPGQARLTELLAPIPFKRSFANSGDPVVGVPLDLPLFGRWEQPITLTMLDVPAVAGDFGPLAKHHMELYAQGIAGQRTEVVVA